MSYKIERVLNNNAVVTLNAQQEEIIITGPGIAFKKKYGGYISKDKVDKIYKLDKAEDTNKLMELFREIPNEYIEIVGKAILMARDKYQLILNDTLYLSLSDHMNSALQRYQQGVLFENKLLWEIKHIYQQEFDIARDVIAMIKEHTGMELPDDEAAFIALHIVNAEAEYRMNDIHIVTKRTNDILKIIDMHFHLQIDKESLAYYRLLTHIKYFVNRILRKEELDINDQRTLYQSLKLSYPNCVKCIHKIHNYLKINEAYDLKEIEKLYLLLHISRLYEK